LNLFRTGINPDLIRKSYLKEVLENPDIVKIMHASTGDALAVYKEGQCVFTQCIQSSGSYTMSLLYSGVRMWNLYDTAIAHKVIQYQNNGTPLTASTLSFNNICDFYGVTSNPLKQFMSGTLWKRQNDLLSERVDSLLLVPFLKLLNPFIF
jgi:hypothetical protein